MRDEVDRDLRAERAMELDQNAEAAGNIPSSERLKRGRNGKDDNDNIPVPKRVKVNFALPSEGGDIHLNDDDGELEEEEEQINVFPLDKPFSRQIFHRHRTPIWTTHLSPSTTTVVIDLPRTAADVKVTYHTQQRIFFVFYRVDPPPFETVMKSEQRRIHDVDSARIMFDSSTLDTKDFKNQY